MIENDASGRITFMEFGKEAQLVIGDERIILLNILQCEINSTRIELLRGYS